MADAFTPNYNLTKPEVGFSDDTWGAKINANLDTLDTNLKAVSNVANAALPKAGGALTGAVTAAADPSAALGLATKQYVDGLVGGSVPPGAVLGFARTSAPTGWLKANGAAVSRATYAALFSIIGTTFGAGDGSTTFNLPDYRGEFIRGLDDGRGVDSGRGIGASQGDQAGSHTHGVTVSVTGSTNTTGAHTHSVSAATGLTAGADTNRPTSFSGTGAAPVAASAGDHSHTVTASGSATTDTGSEAGETRPRNMALLYCIKI